MYTTNTENLPNLNNQPIFDKFSFPVGSICRLYDDVPFYGSYKDVRLFDTQIEQMEYFTQHEKTEFIFEQMTYLRKGQPLKVPVNYEKVKGCTYLSVENTPYDKEHKTYYYFILYAEYVAPDVTKVFIDLDVFQTYLFDYKFNSCFIERKHGYQPPLDQNKTHWYNKGNNYNILKHVDVLNPEFLETGNEYEIISHKFYSEKLLVLVYAGGDLSSDFGTLSNPSLKMAKGLNLDRTPSCYDVYVMRLDSATYSSDKLSSDQVSKLNSCMSFDGFVLALQNFSWISQTIGKITLVPESSFIGMGFSNVSFGGGGVNICKLNNNSISENESFTFDVPDGENFLSPFLEGYARPPFTSKLYTYPYAFIEATTFTGSTLIIKPECFTGVPAEGNTKKLEFQLVNYVGANGKIAYCIKGYNHNDKITTPDYENAVVLNDFPSFPILTNNYINYMASNANALNVAQQANDWNLSKSRMQYDVANQQLANSREAQGLQMDYNQNVMDYNYATAGYQMALNAVGQGANAIGAAVYSGGASLPAGVLNMGLSMAGSQISRQASYDLANMSNTLYGNTSEIQNENTFLSIQNAMDMAAGDYQLSQATLNAKKQDAQLIPPSSTGLQGGDPFMMANQSYGLHLLYKRIKSEFVEKCDLYFTRFGYNYNQWVTTERKPQEFKTRQLFDYVKINEMFIEVTNNVIPQDDLQKLRSIWQAGLTLWHNDNIGKWSMYDNYSRIIVDE